MKIYNWNFKFILLMFVFVILFIFGIVCYVTSSQIIVMNNENYTSILKECHDNPYKFAGKKIAMDGYVFRNEKFSNNQFVVARDMLVSDNESRIVGFLCESNVASSFENNLWVHVVGTITIGDYFGTMPIIKVDSIKKITTPNDTFVSPPKN